MRKFLPLFLLTFLPALAQETAKKDVAPNPDIFKLMYDLMATPNMYRTASGAPGPEYYQQLYTS